VYLRDLLAAAVAARERVLVGFDFPLGYPAGFAAALGLAGWRETWAELSRLVVDDARNANNRFAVAAALNARLGGGPGPFWGCPPSRAAPTLAPTRPAYGRLAEYRLTELRLKARGLRLSSVWKLYAPPTVGSQALLGIPRVRSLVADERLAAASVVWPFEPLDDRRPLVVHCEVWPTAVPIDVTAHPVHDAAQVVSLARWAERLDEEERLEQLLAPELTHAERRRCEVEEGWILGA
jgi:precorrin-8X/cobalt-precorrin-8 methylmutase